MLNSDLTRAFQSAGHVWFDDSSRLVFFGDCHRGDGGWADSFADNHHIFCRALEYYRGRDYTYVEIGDGDDLWSHGNFDAIRHAHRDVFGLLHEFHACGRLHLIWGNHNRIWKRHQSSVYGHCGNYAESAVRSSVEAWRGTGDPDHTASDIYSALFDGLRVHEGLIFQHARTGYRLFATHGHQVDLLSHRLWRISRFCVANPWKLLRWLGSRDPSVTCARLDRPGALERRLQRWIGDHRQPLICGHTHQPAFPGGAGETAYFNVGSCLYPGYITGIEIVAGRATLVKWSLRVAPGRAASSPVVREVVVPPWPLVSHHQGAWDAPSAAD
jgi:UDP-2,3-diacylglucosamine pyrophosphatase LpxH